MKDELTLRQKIVLERLLIKAGVYECKHNITFEDFCIVCYRTIKNTKK